MLHCGLDLPGLGGLLAQEVNKCGKSCVSAKIIVRERSTRSGSRGGCFFLLQKFIDFIKLERVDLLLVYMVYTQRILRFV